MLRRVISVVCLLLAIGTIWSCAPRPQITPGPGDAGERSLVNAEKLYGVQSYDEALALYSQYVASYPDRPNAPAALMKIGAIYALQKKTAEARGAYQRLVSQYPDSPLVTDARIEILATYYAEHNYEEVIALANQTLDKTESQNQIFRIYTLIGDAYLAKGSAVNAFQYYLEALKISTDKNREASLTKLRESIAQLSSEEIALIKDLPQDPRTQGDLWFQLGLNYTMEGDYDLAEKTLTEFITRFPDHERVLLARQLLSDIQGSALFNRYTVGCLLPLSGSYETFGLKALRGIELALAQFSAVNTNPSVQILVKDTGADPEKTAQATQELIKERVALIVGPMVTAEIAARIAQDHGIPIVTFTQKDNICEIGPEVFRNFITPKMQMHTLAAYAVESMGLRRFAILYPNENYGRTYMNLFWDEVLQLGGKVVGLESYDPDQTDFADSIKKLVGLFYPLPEDLKDLAQNTAAETSNVAGNTYSVQSASAADKEKPQPIVDFQAVFIPDAAKTAGLIVPQLPYHDVKGVQLLGTNLWHSQVLIDMAHQYIQGAILPDGFFAESQVPQVREFVRTFEETYQEQPGFIEAIGYDTANIAFQVISRPDIRFRADIANKLMSPEGFAGITGFTRFDERGESLKKLYLLQIRGNTFVELGRN
jgi:branched-chain amino acid transport system substrate-binding protein